MRDKEAGYQHAIIICLRRGNNVSSTSKLFQPKNRKELQRLPGFNNFYPPYRRDPPPPPSINSPPENYFSTGLPLPNRLLIGWSSVLIQVDQSWPFVVEVDALDSGMVAVLLQQVDGKLHPCAFFSQHLSQAEWNYGMGKNKAIDWELLAIKLAVEEWRHWIEGKHPHTHCLDRPQNFSIPSSGQVPKRPAS